MITKYGAQKILNWFIKGTTSPANSLYAALSSTLPALDGTNVTEPTKTSYARVQLNSTNSNDATLAFYGATAECTDNGAVVKNTKIIYFPETYNSASAVNEDWGELNYVCLFDAKTGGGLLAFQELPEPIHPGADNVSTIPIIRVGDLSINISNDVQ